ncbi:DUF402 domain-containing protein [Kitasatospora sp. NPDC088134]|uniref:DUF402 domain-containing protein n=1 Tax=Kitasatospora sp. NPDC088134 TaxID=3364071 RepID=UPI00381D0F69
MTGIETGAGAAGGPLFGVGERAVRRDVHRGRVWSARPYRVLADGGEVLELACWPGIEGLAPTSWIDALRTGEETPRKDGLDRLADGTWRLGPHRWQDTAVLARFLAGEWFSVHCFQDAATGEPLRWYVNFELPYVRRPGVGVDTMDLAIDLVVSPDLSRRRWKDVDEYGQLRRLGVIDDGLDRQVRRARERASGLLDERAGPFAGGWPRWTPDPHWPLPVLPADAGD